jgi:hypothetical protein
MSRLFHVTRLDKVTRLDNVTRLDKLPDSLLNCTVSYLDFGSFLAVKRTNKSLNKETKLQPQEITFIPQTPDHHRSRCYRSEQRLRVQAPLHCPDHLLNRHRFDFAGPGVVETDNGYGDKDGIPKGVVSKLAKLSPRVLDLFHFKLDQAHFDRLIGSVRSLENLRIDASYLANLNILATLPFLYELCLYEAHDALDYSVLGSLSRLKRLSLPSNKNFLCYLGCSPLLPPRLERLILFGYHLPLSEDKWFRSLESTPCIQEIESQGSPLDIVKILKIAPSIQTIRCNNFWSDETDQKISDSPFHFVNMNDIKTQKHQVLQISIAAQKDHVDLLLTIEPETLQELRYSASCFQKNYFPVDVKEICQFKNLTNLSLFGNHKNIDGFTFFILCQTLTKLETLKLEGIGEFFDYQRFTPESSKPIHFFDSLQNLSLLKRLDLSKITFYDEWPFPNLPNLIEFRAFRLNSKLDQVLLACPKLQKLITPMDFERIHNLTVAERLKFDKLLFAIAQHPTLTSWHHYFCFTGHMSVVGYTDLDLLYSCLNKLVDYCENRGRKVLELGVNWCHIPKWGKLKCFNSKLLRFVNLKGVQRNYMCSCKHFTTLNWLPTCRVLPILNDYKIQFLENRDSIEKPKKKGNKIYLFIVLLFCIILFLFF